MIADIGIMITIVGLTMKRTVMNKTITPAKGTKGFIIKSWGELGEWFFRVYNEDHSFTDYRIEHCDLEVTIECDDARFYKYENEDHVLDYSYEIAEKE